MRKVEDNLDKKEGREIGFITIFKNGMVAVCDRDGQQMPWLQGKYSEMEPLICEAIGKQKYLPEIIL
jgi:hypothetical protein